MSPFRRAASSTFRSLSVRNYRLYFTGQIISASGTWMQSVAQMWLVLELTGSPVALGTTTALQFTPMLLGGVWGGVVADRVDKRKLLIWSQAAAAVPAVALGTLTAIGAVQLWMIYVLAFVLGIQRVFDVPARQSFVMDMVGAQNLTNAVSLNSSVMTSARVVGPAIAGLTIARVGIAPCFFINAASFVAVIFALARMNPAELHAVEREPKARGQLRAGLRYAWTTPELRRPLVMLAIVGTFALNTQIVVPVIARQAFNAGPETFGLLSAMIGAGAAVGALLAASRTGVSQKQLTLFAFAFGTFMLLASAAPTLPLEMVALVPMGAAMIAFLSTANATLQLTASPGMRGRIMALYSVLLLGSTPIGGPAVGAVMERFGPRGGFVVGGVASLVAAGIGLLGIRSIRRAADLESAQREPASQAAPVDGASEDPRVDGPTGIESRGPSGDLREQSRPASA